MVVAGSLDSRGGACAVDKSQRCGSNGSSKQHGAGQMPVPTVGAFDCKPSHTVPVSWWLADAPHVAKEPDSSTVNVCVSSAAATVADCKLVAAVRKSDAGS